MNDRYLYRAKCKKTDKKWVQGYYMFCHVRNLNKSELENAAYNHWIVTHDGAVCQVAPSTICQCSGKPDKNNNLIFENDLVNANGTVYVCRFDEDNFAWEFQNNDETIGICCFFPIDIEIVGNTYDNPELLEDFE